MTSYKDTELIKKLIKKEGFKGKPTIRYAKNGVSTPAQQKAQSLASRVFGEKAGRWVGKEQVVRGEISKIKSEGRTKARYERARAEVRREVAEARKKPSTPKRKTSFLGGQDYFSLGPELTSKPPKRRKGKRTKQNGMWGGLPGDKDMFGGMPGGGLPGGHDHLITGIAPKMRKKRKRKSKKGKRGGKSITIQLG